MDYLEGKVEKFEKEQANLESSVKKLASSVASLKKEKDGYSKIEPNAQKILDSLSRNDGFLLLNDKSAPEKIKRILIILPARLKVMSVYLDNKQKNLQQAINVVQNNRERDIGYITRLLPSMYFTFTFYVTASIDMYIIS